MDDHSVPESSVEAREVCREYTPAMLAELLGIGVPVLRGWMRLGLLVPTREVHRLSYFDYQGLNAARQLARWTAEGISPRSIRQDLTRLAKLFPGPSIVLGHSSIVNRDGSLLIRDAIGLVDPRGQRRFEFEPPVDETDDATPTLEISRGNALPDQADLDSMLRAAILAEEEGDIPRAIQCYRTALQVGGPQPEINFALAESLYRLGDLAAARERYACAVELDADYVEARANLGCILAELGQPLEAIACFQETLRRHSAYPDVHYHLATAWDACGEGGQAEAHWKRFLELAPESPWAENARYRLGIPSTPP